MSDKKNITMNCPCCGESFSSIVFNSIWGENSINRILIYHDRINISTCPKCNNKILFSNSLLYNNTDNKFALWFDPADNSKSIENQKRELKQLLGSNADYIINAASIRDWDDFKKIIFNKENDLGKSDFEIFNSLNDYSKLKLKELKTEKNFVCNNCNNSSPISAFRGTCIHCKHSFDNKQNIYIYQLSLYIILYSLCEYDSFVPDIERNNIVSSLYYIAELIGKNKNDVKNENIRNIKDNILSIKKIGGSKTGGHITIAKDDMSKLEIYTTNGSVLETATFNLSIILLSIEYIKKFELKKLWGIF